MDRRRDYFLLGDSNAICDVCGFKFKQSELRKRWDNAMVCSQDWETRHPQDFAKSKPERSIVRDARPGAEPYFVQPNEVKASDL